MYLALTDEQTLLQEAATDALSRQDTVEHARVALDGDAVPSLWDLGGEAGWTGLLTGEDADGVGLAPTRRCSSSRPAAGCSPTRACSGICPRPHCSTRPAPTPGSAAPLARGERRAALVDRSSSLLATVDGDRVTFGGDARGAFDAGGADVLVVVAATADGRPVSGVLDASTAGVAIADRGGLRRHAVGRRRHVRRRGGHAARARPRPRRGRP